MKARNLALLAAGAYTLYRLSQQTGLPLGVQPVTPFELRRYLGRWYELARIDHAADRGLTDSVTHHSLLPNGTLEIARRGFDPGRIHQNDAPASLKLAGTRAVTSPYEIPAFMIIIFICVDFATDSQ